MISPRSVFIATALCTPTSIALAAEGVPIRFSGFDEPVRQIFTIASDAKLVQETWPFTESTIIIACGKGALAVIRVGEKYAALNGYTSSQNDIVKVEDSTGRRSSIIGTNSNQKYRDAGIVKLDASDMAIGYWWGALLAKLRPLAACN